MIVTMAKNIKWVEGSSRESRPAEKRVDLLWLRPGELANVVEVTYTGRGRSKKQSTKVLGHAIILRIGMPGLNGYSEVMWNGQIRSISHLYLRPTDE